MWPRGARRYPFPGPAHGAAARRERIARGQRARLSAFSPEAYACVMEKPLQNLDGETPAGALVSGSDKGAISPARDL